MLSGSVGHFASSASSGQYLKGFDNSRNQFVLQPRILTLSVLSAASQVLQVFAT